MAGDHFVFLMLLQWTLVGGGICKQNVKGVLHGRVELHSCHGPQQNVKSVEWAKYRHSTLKYLLYTFEQPNDITRFDSSQNIQFDKENMSLIFVNLTQEDEGVYLNKIVFYNESTKLCNITLSVLSPPTALRIAVSTSASNRTLILRCEVRGQFLNLRWLRDGLLLPNDQRISMSERNRTVHVSNLTSSDWGTYTCRVSNEDGTSETQVIVTGEQTSLSPNSTDTEEEQPSTKFQYLTGLTLSLAMLLSIILFCICRKEYEYEKFISSQADTSEVEFLPCLYADFIKPKALQQAADEGKLAEDFTKVFYNTAE